MSGHSKWSTICHKKGAADARKGKLFTKYANDIALAVKTGGGDVTMNPALRIAIDKAKSVNMPNSNVERAIKRGTGEDKDNAELYEMEYEGYGPEGIAVIVKTLTDNKNRTVANVRSVFSKSGGNLGEKGCVGWMFSEKGIITLEVSSEDREKVELLAIDLGATDVGQEGDHIEITTASADFFRIKGELEKSGFKIVFSEVSLVPANTVRISGEEDARKVLGFLNTLDDDEDVTSVASNFDIPDEILKKISNS